MGKDSRDTEQQGACPTEAGDGCSTSNVGLTLLEIPFFDF